MTAFAFRPLEVGKSPPRDSDRPFRPAPRGKSEPLAFDNRTGAITSRLDPLGTYAGHEELDGRLRPTAPSGAWSRKWNVTDHDRSDEDYDR